MSTRAMIGKLTPEGKVVGRYHHFDGDLLEKTLIDLYYGHFNQNLEEMLSVLIDQHPGGWSNIINCDFNLECGWGLGEKNPTCHCHGHQKEVLPALDGEDLKELDYGYVFDPASNLLAVHHFSILHHLVDLTDES